MTSSTLTAEEVADLIGWQTNSVYRNRGRTLARQARGVEIRPHDFPAGEYTDHGLRWSREAIDAYEQARAKYRARGGRPRARDNRAAPDRGSAGETTA